MIPTNSRTSSICSCLGLGRDSLMAVVQERDIRDLTALQELTAAGTICRSCVPDLRCMLRWYRLRRFLGSKQQPVSRETQSLQTR